MAIFHPPRQYFYTNTQIILKKNLWKEMGLFNGSKGTIEDIIVGDDNKLIAILVKFDDFTGGV